MDGEAAESVCGPEEAPASFRVVRYSGISLPSDFENMVQSRWKRSLRYGNDYFKLVRPDAYYEAYDKYIGRILMRQETSIRVAVLSDAPDVALGFAVHRGKILDFVHVQRDMRRQGIARALVPANIDTITHLTKTGLAIWSNKCPSWGFNPFA